MKVKKKEKYQIKAVKYKMYIFNLIHLFIFVRLCTREGERTG